MKKIIDDVPVQVMGNYYRFSFYEQRPTRRIITVDYKYLVHHGGDGWGYNRFEWQKVRKQYFLPFPYVYFVNSSSKIPSVLFAKESITKGPTNLLSASALPNTHVDGSVCFGSLYFEGGSITSYQHGYWNTPFAVKPGDGFDIERHLSSWVRKNPKELGPALPAFNKKLGNISSSNFSDRWREDFKTEFSFESWQNLTDKEFDRVRFDDLGNVFVEEFLNRWWNEKDLSTKS